MSGETITANSFWTYSPTLAHTAPFAVLRVRSAQPSADMVESDVYTTRRFPENGGDLRIARIVDDRLESQLERLRRTEFEAMCEEGELKLLAAG